MRKWRRTHPPRGVDAEQAGCREDGQPAAVAEPPCRTRRLESEPKARADSSTAGSSMRSVAATEGTEGKYDSVDTATRRQPHASDGIPRPRVAVDDYAGPHGRDEQRTPACSPGRSVRSTSSDAGRDTDDTQSGTSPRPGRTVFEQQFAIGTDTRS